MFTRVVELTCNSGQAQQLCRTIDEKVLPILKKQQGFRDEITMASTDDPERVLAISFWNSREDAERYERQEYQKIIAMVRNLCQTDPMVDTFNVESSTAHRVSAGKAA